MDDDDDEDSGGEQEEMKVSSSESSSRSSNSEQKKDPFLRKLKISTRGNAYMEVKDPEFMIWCALRGHVRIHAKERKLKDGDGGTTSLRKPKRKKIYEPELGSAERGETTGYGEELMLPYTCRVCDESKSLCGHMKTHSERSSKAVQTSKMSDGGKDLFPELDLLKGLKSWSRTAKRGRLSSADVEPGAARGLTKLSRATPTGVTLELSVRPVICEKKNATRSQYKCATCQKTFPALRALICHQSDHNKDPGSIAPPWELSPYPDQEIIAGNSVKEEQNSRRHCLAGNLCETNHGRSPAGLLDLNEMPPIDAAAAIDSRSKS